MKDLYILAYAQNPIVADAKAANEVELIMPVVHEVFDQTGLPRMTQDSLAQEVVTICKVQLLRLSKDYQQFKQILQ